MFSLLPVPTTCWTHSGVAGNLRRHNAHVTSLLWYLLAQPRKVVTNRLGIFHIISIHTQPNIMKCFPNVVSTLRQLFSGASKVWYPYLNIMRHMGYQSFFEAIQKLLCLHHLGKFWAKLLSMCYIFLKLRGKCFFCSRYTRCYKVRTVRFTVQLWGESTG